MSNILRYGFKADFMLRSHFPTTVTLRHKNVDNRTNQQAKILNKLMNRLTTKRSTQQKGSNAALIPGYAIGLPNLESSKRMAALNKTYFNILNDVIGSEEVSSLVRGYDVQITHVKVSPDFSSVNVFWIMSPKFNIHEVEEKLKVVAQQIRKFIVNEGILSHVPNVTFVCNKLAFTEMEVCKRLSALNLSYNNEVKCEIQIEKKRRYLCNLDREGIYKKIVYAKEKNMGMHRLEDIYRIPQSSKLPTTQPPTPLDIDVLKKFLRKRKAQHKEAHQMQENAISCIHQTRRSDEDHCDDWEDFLEETILDTEDDEADEN